MNIFYDVYIIVKVLKNQVVRKFRTTDADEKRMRVSMYNKKYRIQSTRLPHWDYGSNGYYFVTICTKNKKHFFGKHMQLSKIGQVAQKCWIEIPDHFPFVHLDAFVVMPNHVHGIIIINKANNLNHVETQDFTSLHRVPCNQFGPQSQNLASIIRGYKIGVTKNARQIDPDFSWQPRYYDHIIRDEKSMNRIRQYIQFNPEKWDYDWKTKMKYLFI